MSKTKAMVKRLKGRKPCRLNFTVSEKFKSWLAGLIDGEGNFYMQENGSNPQIRIVLTEADKFVLEYIVSTLGGSLRYRKPQKSWKSNWKPQWQWGIFTVNSCLSFTEWIIPDLILKKEIATLFLEKLKLKRCS